MTNNVEKITKREKYVALVEFLKTVEANEMFVELCEGEIVAIDKKAAKAKENAAAKKSEGDELMAQVREALTGEFRVIADIAADVAEVNPDATVSRVTYRLTKLVESGCAEKTDVTVPGVDGGKNRKVKAFRLVG